jgi:hypothetical protein
MDIRIDDLKFTRLQFINRKKWSSHRRSDRAFFKMPSHDIGVQERELCSDRRSTCDRSRGAASRYHVGSSPGSAHSTACRAIACGVFCHSPGRISCGVSSCKQDHVRGCSYSKTRIRDQIFSSSQIVLECGITVQRPGGLQAQRIGLARFIRQKARERLASVA